MVFCKYVIILNILIIFLFFDCLEGIKEIFCFFFNNFFIIKWDDRSYDVDVYIIFDYDEMGKVQFVRFKFIFDVMDFSFDFDDLDLRKK